MHIDYLLLIIIGIIAGAGGLVLLNEAKKYRARHRKDDSAPPDERWLSDPALKEKLSRADEWMHGNSATDTDLDELQAKADTRKILLKHSFCDGRDCELEWSADFAKMEILLRVPFISPALILNFLPMLPGYDERFRQTGITGMMNIATRFNIKLCVAHGQEGVWYSCRIYKYGIPDLESERWEVELSSLTKSKTR